MTTVVEKEEKPPETDKKDGVMKWGSGGALMRVRFFIYLLC